MSNPFVDVVITRETKVVSQAGFGVPLIFSTEPAFVGVREYSSLDGVLADFSNTTEVYRLALNLFGQDIAPEKIKVAKRLGVGAVEVELQGIINIDNDWYALFLDTDDQGDILDIAEFIEGIGATNKKTFWVLLRESDVVDATLTDTAALLEALGYDRTVVCFTKPNVVQIVTVTFDADLITGNSITNIKVNGIVGPAVPFNTDHITTMNDLAAQIAGEVTVDSAVVGGAGNRTLTITMNEFEDNLFEGFVVTGGASQASTAILETQAEDSTRENNRNHAAWVGGQIPKDPGSITWKFKILKGNVADKFTDTEVTNVESKKTNIYRSIGGVDVMSEGVVVSGEFIDVIHGVDFLQARMTENIFQALIDNDKIPFTNAGIDVIRSKINQILQLGIAQGILSNDPAPSISMPDVKNIPTADKGVRLLKDVKWEATLAGAIHKVKVRGTVSL